MKFFGKKAIILINILAISMTQGFNQFFCHYLALAGLYV